LTELSLFSLGFPPQGKTLPAPAVEFPYFPPASSAKGEALLAAQKDTRGGPLVAHQLCALQVFQARITRSRYAAYSCLKLRCFSAAV
jgi:hypothetical protein